jgi:hypothetical protein
MATNISQALPCAKAVWPKSPPCCIVPLAVALAAIPFAPVPFPALQQERTGVDDSQVVNAEVLQHLRRV